MSKSITLFFLIVLLKTVNACECPPLQPITEVISKNYNAVFYGKVDSITNSSEKGFNTAHFTITELYKGNVQQHVKINFDNSSSCLMSFSKGEEWLIYAIYKNFDFLTVSICGHSRKFFKEASSDFYQLNSKRTFEEEKNFLKSTFNVQAYAKVNELNQQREQFKPHNIQPEPMSKLLLVLISLLSVLIIFFVTRKKTTDDE
jgi:hypothetical protein